MVVEWLKTKEKYASYTIDKGVITVTLTDLVYLSTWYKEFTDEFGLGAIYDYVLEKFDPTQAYKVKVGNYTVIIKLKDDPIRLAYDRVFNYVSPGLIGAYSVEYYSWVVYHTTVINQSKGKYLLGDKEFNRVVVTISSEDIYEVQKKFPRIELDGLTLRLPYLDGMTGIMDELGWNINNHYHVLGSNGYYLPFTLKLELAEVIEWLLGVRRKHGRYITHSSEGKFVVVEVHGRDDFLWLANQLRKDLGNSNFLAQLLTHFRVGAYYTVKHKDYTIQFKHTWTRRNIRYAELVHDLTYKSDFSLVTGVSNPVLLYYRILKDSYYDKQTDSLRLKGYLFGELGITVDKVVGDLEQVRVDVYQETDGAYGQPLPMIYSYGGINIQTPYKIIRDGVHQLECYPVALPPYYDTEPIEEPYINAYIMGEERRKPVGTHNTEDIVILPQQHITTNTNTLNKIDEELDIILPELEDGFTVKQHTDSSKQAYKQSESLPYVSSVSQNGIGSYTVTYIGGEQLTVTLTEQQQESTNQHLYGLVAFKQVGQELTQTQQEVIYILRAVFNQEELPLLTYAPPQQYQEEWEGYLKQLVTLAIRVTKTKQYTAIQALEQHISQYPDYERLLQLETESESEEGLSLTDFMDLLSQDGLTNQDEPNQSQVSLTSQYALTSPEELLSQDESSTNQDGLTSPEELLNQDELEILTISDKGDDSTGFVDIGTLLGF